jgi:hypothetical protein
LLAHRERSRVVVEEQHRIDGRQRPPKGVKRPEIYNKKKKAKKEKPSKLTLFEKQHAQEPAHDAQKNHFPDGELHDGFIVLDKLEAFKPGNSRTETFDGTDDCQQEGNGHKEIVARS